MAASLRAGLAWAAAHAGCSGLNVKADVLLSIAAPPATLAKQAMSVTLRVLLHLRHLQVHHPSPLVQFYAAGFELLCTASLRMRDAQRAVVSYVEDVATLEGQGRLGFLSGVCFSSKHPKRRSAKQKLFFAPLRVGAGGDGPDGYIHRLIQGRDSLGGSGWDYIFPRVSVPRTQNLSSPDAKIMAGPAPSAEAIRHLRGLLTLPPLSLTAAQAAAFSGHSGRHFLVTLAKSIAKRTNGLPRYSDDELSLLGDWLEGSMVTRYSSEQYLEAKLSLLTRLLEDVERLLGAAPGGGVDLPYKGGWAELADLLATPGAAFKVRPIAPSGDLDPEPSDSDSSDSDEDP